MCPSTGTACPERVWSLSHWRWEPFGHNPVQWCSRVALFEQGNWMKWPIVAPCNLTHSVIQWSYESKMRYERISFQVLQVPSGLFLRCAEQSISTLQHSLLGSQKPPIWTPAYYTKCKPHGTAGSLTPHKILQIRKPKSLFSTSSKDSPTPTWFLGFYLSF